MSGLVLIVVALALYFLPTFIAASRQKRNLGAIFALNLLAGWTFVGWLIALVWALTHDRLEPQQVVYVNQPASQRPTDEPSGGALG